MSYEIGYRRPPKDTQFKKGSSGNPKGRTKGSKNFASLLDQELGQSVVVTDNGKKKKLTKQEYMIKKLVATAMQGDVKTMMTIFEMKRRTGGLDANLEPATLLPENYESILDSYVDAQRPRRSEGGPSDDR